MTRFVIDASVALKWLVPEDGTEAAVALLDHDLAAPDLILIECANALWRKQRRGEMTAPEARIATGLLARADIDLAAARPLLPAALDLALLLDHPAYDCLYLALSQATDRMFVTADARLIAQVRTRVPGPLAERARHLSQIDL